jgi:acetyl-CoA acetyltransferase
MNLVLIKELQGVAYAWPPATEVRRVCLAAAQALQLADQAVSAEREACALVCQEAFDDVRPHELAEKIRART